MPLLNFGQPAGGIMQMAYVVTDIRAAIAEWIQRLNVGPWFLLDHFAGVNPVYRGAPSRAEVCAAPHDVLGGARAVAREPRELTRPPAERGAWFDARSPP